MELWSDGMEGAPRRQLGIRNEELGIERHNKLWEPFGAARMPSPYRLGLKW